MEAAALESYADSQSAIVAFTIMKAVLRLLQAWPPTTSATTGIVHVEPGLTAAAAAMIAIVLKNNQAQGSEQLAALGKKGLTFL